MVGRRPLIAGITTPASPVDANKEKEFVFGEKPEQKQASVESPTTPPAKSAGAAPSRAALSTRMRADFSAALKRASLERQLAGIEPNTLTDILEQAVEPWLRSNGYLK
jgi:hypothetical protein